MLTLIRKIERRDKSGNEFGLYSCNCGKEKEIRISSVKSGLTKSCGCLPNKRNKTHGMTNEKMYGVWSSMLSRTTDPRSVSFPYYGGRGIKVCDEWKDFSAFFRDMGETYREGLSIDRIDNAKGYSKENCRWATRTEQQRNRRNNVFLTHDGKTATLAEWCDETNINRTTLEKRLYVLRWPVKKALLTPVQVL